MSQVARFSDAGLHRLQVSGTGPAHKPIGTPRVAHYFCTTSLLSGAVALAALLMIAGCEGRPTPAPEGPRRLTHEETLQWVADHRAWRLARKTKPIWVRPVEPAEVGKEFETADHVAEPARAGYWLCVGVAGEPWFQAPDKVTAKYDLAGEEVRRFGFDTADRTYRVYRPNGDVRNWAAQVAGPGIEGFSIRPNYSPDRPLYSPAGGYVVRDGAGNPYHDPPDDVWLVQQGLFESTYEFVDGPGR
jgi:hypothetical protein